MGLLGGRRNKREQNGEVQPVRHAASTNPIAKAWARMNDFDLLAMFEPKRGPAYPRSVLINMAPPAEATTTGPKIAIPGFSKTVQVEQPDGTMRQMKHQRGFGQQTVPSPGWIYESNQVLTSKYNIITFLPRNLIEQFRRVANVFFLALVILQFFPRFTTVSPGLAALPLLFVLFVTALKDGYEDLKRHQSDRAINNIKVLALRGTYHNHNLTKAKSRSIGVPAFIRNFFKKQSFADESGEEEFDREQRKRGFWGKRRVRRPTLSKGANGQEPAEVPRDAPGGGNVQGGKKAAAAGNEARAPELHERLEGDHYADEAESESGSDNKAHHSAGSHLPFVGHHYDHAVWKQESWEDLQVGDFVRLRGDESVPADLVVVSTSEEENVCYVETKNLDGETNLKSRNAVPELTHLRTSTDIEKHGKFVIEAESASVNMFNFDAAVVLHDGRLGKDGHPLRCPVTLNTTLLRGTVVRNTDWVIGCVTMTGRDSKIVLNSGGTPSKRSKVERLMNPMVFINLALLAVMCTMCAIVDHFLQVDMSDEGAYWLYGNNRSDDNPNINAVITFANAMIAFQNIVPISLYISIEFVRLAQAAFIYADPDICYKVGDTKRRTVARSWNLSDDLGQIEYIFSDKTGTLTQNAMVFQQCSVGGKVYTGDGAVPENTVVDEKDAKLGSSASSDDATRTPSGHEADTEKGFGHPNGGEHKKTKLADQVLAPFHDSEIDRDLAKRDSTEATNLYGFFCNLALCHTVLAQDEDGLIAYKAQSPDEAALVQAAADVGFVFLGRDKNVLRIQTPHDPDVVEYELLNVLEFSSARKRMSVVVKRLSPGHGQGKLSLLSKGADNVIFERLGPGNSQLKKTTDAHLEEFANEGLRTLCLAWKPLEEDEYDAWERDFHRATTLIEGREAEIERVSEKLEQNLILLGATAIEDKLQDGVPETIADLKRAGIKIWVATGDKLETAVAIGKTCNLLSRDMNIIIIKGGSFDEPNSAYAQLRQSLEKFFEVGNLADRLEHQPPNAGLKQTASRRSTSSLRRPGLQRQQTGVSGITDIVGHDNGERPGGYGLVIDGASLRHAFEEPYTKDLLLELATRCKAVICCRTSPLQKALIVRLVKDGLGIMSLAIGDGANDVSMIQAADIGVGVAGEEGLQAVNSSDYAIAQFRYLQRLVLVHGHWSYMRNSTMIVNFFYKEIIGIGILFFFQFYCGYSATTVYEYVYLLLWNIVWTLLPVIVIGVLDQNISDRALVQVPELYHRVRAGKLFGIPRFAIYMLDGIYQSAVIYFLLVYTYDVTTTRSDGWSVGMYEFSTVMCIAAVIACNIYIGMLNTHSWTWWSVGSALVGPVVILAFTGVYAAFRPGLFYTEVYGLNDFLWPSVQFWLGNFLTIVLSLLPRYLYRYYSEMYFPTDIEILRHIDHQDPNHDWKTDRNMPQPLPVLRPGAEKEPSELANDQAALFPPAPKQRQSMQSQRDSFQLGRFTSRQSVTHDMSTGQRTEGSGRGYGFDEAPAAPLSIARYTSRGSDHSSAHARNRKRSGSVRVAGVELNPFARSPNNGGRARSGSLNPFRSVSGRKGAIREQDETAASPTKPSRLPPPVGMTPDDRAYDTSADQRMLGEQRP